MIGKVKTEAAAIDPSGTVSKRLLPLLLIFALSLSVRLYGTLTYEFNYDSPGSYNIINYDQGGSCRAKLGYFNYSEFVGLQVVPIAKWLGFEPPKIDRSAEYKDGVRDKKSRAWYQNSSKVKTYCQSKPLMIISKLYSTLLAAATVVILGLLALFIWPNRPKIAWTACLLLAFCNLHVAHSHQGTIDTTQVFFIMLLILVVAYGVLLKRNWALLLGLPLTFIVVWIKRFYFAPLVFASLLPKPDLRDNWKRYLVFSLILAAFGALFIGFWGTDRFQYMLWGDGDTKFGLGYSNIGILRRLIRNISNVFIVFSVGFGAITTIFAIYGLKKFWQNGENRRLLSVMTPLFAYLAYMALIAPVTYYRHYLPLIPLVAIFAAYGFWESPWAKSRALLALFIIYPALLTLDSEYNYRFDPRRELRNWYQENPDSRTFYSFYVDPPASHRQKQFFNLDSYLLHDKNYLAGATHLILSENWYDTSYPNELNGPIAWNPNWLIKTKPEYAQAYRKILSGRDLNLALEEELNIAHFMPEFLLHRYFYGSFQFFIGDLKIFRVR